MNNTKSQASGFTLIELLVVIAIIGLLASVVLLSLNSGRGKARDAKRIADMKQLATSMQVYFSDNNSYPTAASGSFDSMNGPPNNVQNVCLANPAGQLCNAMVPTYMGTFPSQPAPNDGNCAVTGQNSNQYYYVYNGVNTNYMVTFCLGAATGGYAAGPHTLTADGIQ